MAIKIQGAVIIDDSKNIQSNTGFFSDANNSALRPKSSSGASYFQRWTGSSWEDLLVANNGGIICNRVVNANSGIITNGITSNNGITVNNASAQINNYLNSWNFYGEVNGNTAMRAAGAVFGQIGATPGQPNNWQNAFIGKRENWPPGQPFTRTILETSFLKCEGGFAINPSQLMPFGNTVAPLYIHQQSGGISWSFSSRRNKTNIEDLNIDYKKLLNLRPVTYKDLWIQHPEFDEKTNLIKIDKLRVGLIAEEVYEEIPEICEFGYHYLDEEDIYDLDEYGNETNRRRVPKKGVVKQAVNVNYDRLSAVLIGLLKEMNQEIETLKEMNQEINQEMNQEIETLKEEIQSLKASLQTP